MTDYERVIELQEISQRSMGATSAQAGVYLEGMEAAMNKVTLAWESLVSEVADNEVIINVIERLATVLSGVSSFLSTDVGAIAGITLVATLTTTIVGNKIKEAELARMQQQYTLQQQITEMDIAKTKQEQVVLSKKAHDNNLRELIDAKNILIQKKQETLEEKRQQLIKAEDNKDTITARRLRKEIKKDEKSLSKEQASVNKLQADLAQSTYDAEAKKLDILNKQYDDLQAQNDVFSSIKHGISGLLSPLLAVVTLYKQMTK